MRRLLSLILVLSSCGYKTADPEEKTTIAVPYVKGDVEGQLTGAIVRQLNESGLYEYVHNEGDYELKIDLATDRNDTIGYKYNRSEKKGKIEHNLMATENRRTLTAEIQLLRGEEVVVGPVSVSTSTDYDYIDINSLKELTFTTPQGKRGKTIRLSLGQLDSIEGAQDAALHPLYNQLAQKIVDVLQRSIVPDA